MINDIGHLHSYRTLKPNGIQDTPMMRNGFVPYMATIHKQAFCKSNSTTL